MIDVVLKAKAAEVDAGSNYSIMGVVGSWTDDGDGNPETSGSSDDAYQCWGISTSGVTARPLRSNQDPGRRRARARRPRSFPRPRDVCRGSGLDSATWRSRS